MYSKTVWLKKKGVALFKMTSVKKITWIVIKIFVTNLYHQSQLLPLTSQLFYTDHLDFWTGSHIVYNQATFE